MKLRLQETAAKRFRQAARIDLWAGVLNTARWYTAGEGANDFHSMEIEFGLGSATSVNSVLMECPGDQLQRFQYISADQTFSVLQEAAPSSVEQAEATAQIVRIDNNLNPFTPRTNIDFNLTAPSAIELEIHDRRGLVVKKLLAEFLQSGHHEILWGGSRKLSSGTYLVRLQSTEGTRQNKLALSDNSRKTHQKRRLSK